MKQKFITFLLLLTMAAALFTGTAGAEKDAVDRFADDMRAFKTEIIVPVRDYDALMKETFTRYPELCVYYDGCSYSSQSDGLHLSVRYTNQNVDPDDLVYVDSYDEFFAAVALGYLYFDQPREILCVNGYKPSAEEIQGTYDRMYEDYYLITQGFKTWEYNTAIAWDSYGVAYYSLNYLLWDEATPELVRFWRSESEKKVLELCSTILPQDMPDYEKLFVIHEYLVDNNYYDMDDINVQRMWNNHTAYGTLCSGHGVCQSYAEATRMLCDAVGIPCYYVPGDGNGGAHAWNIVQLQGEWYLIDNTWDDPVTDDGTNLKYYTYFVITEEEMRKDHTWEYEKYPRCTATDLDYETIVSLMEQDETVYTDFDTSGIRTEAVMEAELLALLGEHTPYTPEDEQEEPPVDEEEEPPVDEEEEPPVDEEEEPPVDDEEEPPVDDEEEPPVDEDEEPPVDDQDEKDEQEQDQKDEQDKKDDQQEQDKKDEQEKDEKEDPLKEIIQLKKDREEKEPVKFSTAILVILVVLGLCAVITFVVVNSVANSRVMTAREERSRYRARHVGQNIRRRRRF